MIFESRGPQALSAKAKGTEPAEDSEAGCLTHAQKYPGSSVPVWAEQQRSIQNKDGGGGGSDYNQVLRPGAWGMLE